jgi:peptidyl-tRNA hydrolase, PTH1 family
MAFSALLVGLGNPGPKYDDTRHNFGFLALDFLLEEADRRNLPAKRLSAPRKNMELWAVPLFGPKGRVPGEYLAAKPLTYMNLSGEAVAPVCSFFKLPPENVVVLHDEIDLPLGRLKIKSGGGNAGHRGLESISAQLGTNNFRRVRMGIGRPLPGRDVKGFVLEKFTLSEKDLASQVARQAMLGLAALFTEGLEASMRLLNGFDAAKPAPAPRP